MTNEVKTPIKLNWTTNDGMTFDDKTKAQFHQTKIELLALLDRELPLDPYEPDFVKVMEEHPKLFERFLVLQKRL